MQKLNIWAPPGIWGPWHEIASLIGGPSTYKISFDTVSDAPSSFQIEVQYYRGNELVTDSVVGPNSHTFGMGSCVCIAKARARSHSLGQNIEVTLHY